MDRGDAYFQVIGILEAGSMLQDVRQGDHVVVLILQSDLPGSRFVAPMQILELRQEVSAEFVHIPSLAESHTLCRGLAGDHFGAGLPNSLWFPLGYLHHESNVSLVGCEGVIVVFVMERQQKQMVEVP